MKERIKNCFCNLLADLVVLPAFILVLAGIASFIPGPVIEQKHHYSVSVSSDDSTNLVELVKSAKVEDKVTTEVKWSDDEHYSLLDFIKDRGPEVIDGMVENLSARLS